MKELSEEEVSEISKEAREKADGYYEMFLKSQIYWNQDLRAVGKTEEEILKEFITTAYWYGYMDGKIKDEP